MRANGAIPYTWLFTRHLSICSEILLSLTVGVGTQTRRSRGLSVSHKLRCRQLQASAAPTALHTEPWVCAQRQRLLSLALLLEQWFFKKIFFSRYNKEGLYWIIKQWTLQDVFLNLDPSTFYQPELSVTEAKMCIIQCKIMQEDCILHTFKTLCCLINF